MIADPSGSRSSSSAACARNSALYSTTGGQAAMAGSSDPEALRAVRRAMPHLRRAKRIEIAVVDPASDERSFGAELALFLARHGIGIETATHARAGRTVADLRCQRAADIGADLLVMGAYGHSRLREFVIGGVTRDILGATPIPVLMAH